MIAQGKRHVKQNQKRLAKFCAALESKRSCASLREASVGSATKAAKRKRSKAAISDIILATEYVISKFDIANKEIYLFGGSGGGHAALLATAYKPELWNTVISYVPIVDIRKWHAECKSRGLEFYKDIEACIGECTPDNYLYFVKSQRRLKRQQKNRAPV